MTFDLSPGSYQREARRQEHEYPDHEMGSSWDPENNVAANDSNAPIVTGINSFLMAHDPFESDITNHDMISNQMLEGSFAGRC